MMLSSKSCNVVSGFVMLLYSCWLYVFDRFIVVYADSNHVFLRDHTQF